MVCGGGGGIKQCSRGVLGAGLIERGIPIGCGALTRKWSVNSEPLSFRHFWMRNGAASIMVFKDALFLRGIWSLWDVTSTSNVEEMAWRRG
ncbi:hypothetical protein MCA1215 [Methylococcus capsulatus str. Bath]|uniref:Uncharacterized protein n=1 Tax=Methylococcus capsulatus (strain ATCC 33009 / NCIMB 11132 / Bath) TaxID=243233 RepID=Q609L8_METCA|nr:hypothetical protein MCA1215 [Methylococcus capsulatus str. Bath]